jgi:CMP-N-acetylneuraminic acid synthetase
MKIVCFVPIKLKSQRLPDKMLLPLGNCFLFQHIFNTLNNVKNKLSQVKDINLEIYCYCSDESIKDSLPENVNFLKRDSKLDRDETKGIEIYKSFCDQVESDVYMLCHATSPFIKSKSIIDGINKIINEGYDSSMSVSKIQTFCWYDNKTLNYELTNVVRTQDIKPVYWETSAFYIFKSDILKKHGRRVGFNPYLVATDRIESIDIDEKEDYDLAKSIINNTN